MTKQGFSKTELLDALHNHVCEVSFIKADGSIRDMKCTLLTDYLPPQTAPKSPPAPPNDEIVKCWDIDKGAWRSFRIDSIQSFGVRL